MAKYPILNVEARTSIGSGKLNQLRNDGFIPCNIYGVGMDNINAQINEREFSQLIATAASENILVDLKIGGEKKFTLLKDVQKDHLKDKVIHVDFLVVTDNTEVSSLVLVVIEGEAPGVAAGGSFEQVIYELPVRCQVKNLPETIVVDVSALQVGEVIRVGDIKLPGVDIVTDQEAPVAVVEARRGAAVAAEEEA